MRFSCLILIVIVGFLLLAIGGCNEAQVSRKVWGQGELTAEWKSFFGDSNTARLDFIQTQRINRQNHIIIELMARVRKLEADDPNDPYKAEMKKRGIVK